MFQLLLIAALFIPKANDLTIQTSPLKAAESAYIDNGDGTASIKIGTDTADPIDVFSVQGFRTYEYEQIDRSKWSYAGSPIWKYATNDMWYAREYPVLSGTVHTISFQCPSSVKIAKIEYEKFGHAVGAIGVDVGYNFKEEIKGNIATLTFEPYANLDEMWVKKVKIYTLKYGSEDYVTDFRNKKFIFIDSYGNYIDFNEFQYKLLHYYDGNRGEHWADYPATNTVKLGLSSMTLGNNFRSNDTFRVSANRISPNTLTIQKADMEALGITDCGDGYVPTGAEDFRVVSISVTNTTLWLTINVSGITGFNQSKVAAFGTVYNPPNSGKDTVWKKMPLTYISTSGNLVTFTAEKGTALYTVRVKYGVATTLVNVPGVLKTSKFQLLGDDNILYELHINGGVISATPVTP